MRHNLLLILTLLLLDCASIHVTHDYETSVDFKAFKTYNYFSDIESGMSELDTKRFIDVFNQVLQSKGYKLSENPDFLIDFTSNDTENMEQNNVGFGVAGTNGNMGGGITIGLPVVQQPYIKEVTIEFVDKNSVGLFWQAIAHSGYNPKFTPEKKTDLFEKIVTKALLNFPPETAQSND
jgi:hypothetical protein